jgi:DNA-binding response OmpR family regulator
MKRMPVRDDSQPLVGRSGEGSVPGSPRVTLNAGARTAHVGDRTVRLTPVEFRLLEELLRGAGQILTREQLLSAVWGNEAEPRSNIVDAYVCRLRRKLGEGSVQTLHGVGYRLGLE